LQISEPGLNDGRNGPSSTTNKAARRNEERVQRMISGLSENQPMPEGATGGAGVAATGLT